MIAALIENHYPARTFADMTPQQVRAALNRVADITGLGDPDEASYRRMMRKREGRHG
jgi:hypothetical protein